MMMDEEMGEPLEGDFLSLEIDLDYEFDAARYFDFSRQETIVEASEAQLWFETAGSYPPSPFIARLNMGADVLVENVNTLPKFKDAESSDYVSAESNIDSSPEFSTLDETSEVCTVQNGTSEDVARENRKFIKGPFSRRSTLMKPTASRLAKQTRLREVSRSQLLSRFPKPSLQKREGVTDDSSETGGHASKRQKLEGGHLWKVAGVKEKTDLLRKAPQKKSVPADFNPHHSRLRITIPREPELETAQRAQRQRAKKFRSDDAKQSEERKAPAIPTFKALPLNRKILEAPSLPLPQKSTPRLPHFQTEERALQHTANSSSSIVGKNPFAVSTVQPGAPGLRKLKCQSSGSSLPQIVEQKREGCDSVQTKFKAQPINKKILSSKGDIGVFRSTKRETTKPVEFNFATSKRCQQDPPTELFNKLSLNADMHHTPTSNTMFVWPSHGVNKDCKENVNCTLQQGHKVNCKIQVHKPKYEHPVMASEFHLMLTIVRLTEPAEFKETAPAYREALLRYIQGSVSDMSIPCFPNSAPALQSTVFGIAILSFIHHKLQDLISLIIREALPARNGACKCEATGATEESEA